jgi:two-component system, NarL family, sensor histidine kinase FusK
MHLNIKKWPWLQDALVVVLYFASYSTLLHVSFSFWLLPAGLRLTCLLLLPYRLWPALAIGESMGLAKSAYDCYAVLGPVYAFVSLFPPSLIAMPIVRWARQRLALFGPQQQIRMGGFMFCTFLVSLVLASFNFFLVWVTPDAPGQEPIGLEWLPRYFIGQYLGALTIVPVALMIWQAVHTYARATWWTRLSASRLAMDSVALVLPSLLLLMWIAAFVPGELGQAARFAMFLPVAALAMRHGWRGAAIGGALASIAIVVVLPAPHDPVTMQAEVFMALTISMLMMLGARITSLHTREEKERQDGRLALQVAQEGFYLSELRLQEVADRVEDIGDAVRYAHDRLITRLNRLLPMGEERGFQKQAVATQHEIFQLADGIHPRGLARNGLAFVLQHGTIAQAFGRQDVPYTCELRGVPLTDLSPSTQLALYRLACEAANYLFEQAFLTHVMVRIRTGATGSRHWAVLQMDGSHARNREGPMPSRAECQQFRERLGANGAGVEDIRNRTRIYRGAARSRPTANGTRLSLLLHDVERTSAPY